MKPTSFIVALALVRNCVASCRSGVQAHQADRVCHSHRARRRGRRAGARHRGAMEKEKLMPVRMQVVNKTGGGGHTAMSYLVEKKGDTHTIAVFTGLWFTNPIMRAGSEYHPEGSHTAGAAGARAGDDRGEERCAVQDAQGLHRRCEAESRAAQAVGGIDRRSRDWRGAPAADEEYRRELGLHLISRRRRAHRGAARRTRQHHDDRAAGSGRAHSRRQHARPGAISEKRLAAFPDVPTLKEAGFDVPNVPQLRGIVAPPGIPGRPSPTGRICSRSS